MLAPFAKANLVTTSLGKVSRQGCIKYKGVVLIVCNLYLCDKIRDNVAHEKCCFSSYAEGLLQLKSVIEDNNSCRVLQLSVLLKS